MFSDKFSLGIYFITVGVKRCFSVLWDNYQTNNSVRSEVSSLPFFHRSPEVNQRWEFVRSSGKFSLTKLRSRPASKDSVNNYTSPSVGCLVYFHNGVSIGLSLCMMFLPLTVILRWARVFLPGGWMQMSLIIRDDLEDDDEEIENGL